jgi:hypothetical protein
MELTVKMTIAIAPTNPRLTPSTWTIPSTINSRRSYSQMMPTGSQLELAIITTPSQILDLLALESVI